MSRHGQLSAEMGWWARARDAPRGVPGPAFLAFGVALAGTLVVAMLQGEKPFFTDAGVYWLLGKSFTVNGHFSLLNFSHEVKGYVWALILHGVQVLASYFQWTASSSAKVFNVCCFAAIGTVLVPTLMAVVWPTQPRWGVVRRIVLTALLVVFWSGFLNFPMSDFPALATALLTLVAVARIDSPVWMLVAGASLAMTLNIREAYAPFVPAVLAIVVWTWLDQRGKPHASRWHRVLCGALLVLGFAAVSLPQSLSAHRYFGTWSFVPGASVTQPAGEFYASGIGVQAYDTYVFNGAASVQMKYLYPAGQRLLEAQPEGKVTSTSQYLELYVSHPFIMANVIVRHVVNGLDPLYSTPFVENIHDEGHTWGRVAGFLLVFAALLRLLWPAARRMLGPARLRYLGALAVCVLTTLPTQMERRYMLPIYVIVYALALTPRWPTPVGPSSIGLRRFQTPAIITVCFVAFALVVWYITSDAISHLALVG